ncbi:MAG TPA: NAD-dependent epimerase/dehydratase family protein [Gaiellaceae bacterium]|nr:NAD-dependent epimerase/dehydratase family protein [Gaiellaceae bacterium]
MPAVPIEGSRFLVTGGSGFVGSHVVDELVGADAKEVVVFDKVVRGENLEQAARVGSVTVVEGDVTDREALAAAAAGVDGVFHLAVLPIGPSEADPRLALDVNVVGTFNVIEAAQQAGARKVVYSSASSVYGDTNETMDESHPLEARSMYGASKIAGEYFLRAFREIHGLDFVTLRYMNVYGPRQEGGLIVSVLRRIESGQPPVIQGDGSASFDFVHVADVARLNVAAMISDVSGEAFNVGSGGEASVREVVEQLIQLTGSELEPEYDLEAKVLMARRVGKNEKAVQVLGWTPERDLDTGLAEVIAFERARERV